MSSKPNVPSVELPAGGAMVEEGVKHLVVSNITRNCKGSPEPELSGLSGILHDLVGRPGLDPGTLGLKVPCSSR